MPNFKEKVAFFDIDGTIRTKPLPESLYEILIRDYKYRGNNLEKYQGFQNEIKELRKAYKTSERILMNCLGNIVKQLLLLR